MSAIHNEWNWEFERIETSEMNRTLCGAPEDSWTVLLLSRKMNIKEASNCSQDALSQIGIAGFYCHYYQKWEENQMKKMCLQNVNFD